ncbi:nucleoside deaminase, partial [Desulfovibrio sp. 1188_IL3213]
AGLVYGAADVPAGAVVSRAEYFDAQSANHSLWHMGGVRGEECAALLRDFFVSRRDRADIAPG